MTRPRSIQEYREALETAFVSRSYTRQYETLSGALDELSVARERIAALEGAVGVLREALQLAEKTMWYAVSEVRNYQGG